MTELKDLKVGDRIRVIAEHTGKTGLIGREGVIVAIDENHFRKWPVAEFRGWEEGHGGNLADNSKSRWFLWERDIEVEKIDDEHEFKMPQFFTVTEDILLKKVTELVKEVGELKAALMSKEIQLLVQEARQVDRENAAKGTVPYLFERKNG